MTKPKIKNDWLITLGVSAPFLKWIGYFIPFVNRPVQELLSILLFFGAGPIGFTALLFALIQNRKKLRLFGWLGILIFMTIDFFMIPMMPTIGANLFFRNRIKSHQLDLLVFDGRKNGNVIVNRQTSGTHWKRIQADWESIQSFKKPFALEFRSAEITDEDIARIDGNIYIRKISFKDCPNISDQAIRQVSRIPNLEIVSFTNIPRLEEPDFADLANLKKLFCIKLAYCTNLSERSLESFPQSPRLKYFSLLHCPHVSQDIIRQLNNKNPKCKIYQEGDLPSKRMPRN